MTLIENIKPPEYDDESVISFAFGTTDISDLCAALEYTLQHHRELGRATRASMQSLWLMLRYSSERNVIEMLEVPSDTD